MNKKAIRCSSLFDPVSGQVLKDRIILVEDNRISDIKSGREAANLNGWELIDLTGKFVTPGLIDCHMHVCMNGETDRNLRMSLTLGDQTLRGLSFLQADLLAGFTTVRTAGDVGYVAVALRDAINKGLHWGPRVMAPGSILCTTGGHGDSRYNPYLIETIPSGAAADGPTALVKAVRQNIKYGADCIKFVATGGVMSRGTTVGEQQMTLEEMRAVVDTAKQYGLTTFVHAHGTSGIKDAARAGVTSVEHGTLLDEEAVALMAENGCTLVPTIIACHQIVTEGPKGGDPPWMTDKAKQVIGRYEWNIPAAKQAGIPIAFGTDAGTPHNPHGAQAKEFELLVHYGLSPLEALTAATKTAAQLLGKWEEIGSVEPGKLADIAAFSGDPLEDITAMTRCGFVMKNGVVYKG